MYMKKWVGILLVFISINANSTELQCESKNYDQIGTFLGGDDPFPWARPTGLPSDTSGIWEVRNSLDGAYFIITQDTMRLTARSRVHIHMFDPCTFELSAAGTAFVKDNALYSTVGYSKDRTYKRNLIFKAFQSLDNPKETQLVLMVMNTKVQTVVDKYFAVDKVSFTDIEHKCVNTSENSSK